MKNARKIERIKEGGRHFGHIYQRTDTLEFFYLADRRTGEIFRSGEKSIGAAIRAGNACWAIDLDTLMKLRSRRIRFCGVRVKESKDVYLTGTDRFFDRARSTVQNYSSRGGALQSYLPLEHFQRKPGKIRI